MLINLWNGDGKDDVQERDEKRETNMSQNAQWTKEAEGARSDGNGSTYVISNLEGEYGITNDSKKRGKGRKRIQKRDGKQRRAVFSQRGDLLRWYLTWKTGSVQLMQLQTDILEPWASCACLQILGID